MLKDLIDTFRKPSARVIAQRELEDAKRELLQAQTAAEYATRLAQYHADRIHRLSAYVKDDT